MAERKQITLTLPTELVASLDLAARERCVGRTLLIETLLTQGLRHLMPADAYLFGVTLDATESSGVTDGRRAWLMPTRRPTTDTWDGRTDG